jgi:site-specific recombinase XerD
MIAWLMVDRYGELADFLMELHPHMLRHACGFTLADKA